MFEGSGKKMSILRVLSRIHALRSLFFRLLSEKAPRILDSLPPSSQNV